MGEQLMTSTPRGQQVSITDPKVCRSYLVGVCPQDLFPNTKHDFAICSKIHSEPLKNEYEAADEQQKIKWGFEFDYLREISRGLDICNRRIEDARRKLEPTPDEIRKRTLLLQEINRLKENIEGANEEVRLLGEQGAVSLALMEHWKTRSWHARKDELQKELKAMSDNSGASAHQRLEVCDVCGAYLSRLDNDRRLADHFFGKQHRGYAQMRKAHEELKEKLRDRRPPPREEPASNGWGPRGGYDDGDGRRGYGRGGGGGGGGGRGRGRGRGRW